MAHLHDTTLVPSKIELLQAWAPQQSWFAGDANANFDKVGSFRFDDPDGQVGVETLLVQAGNGPILQIPLTYRNDEVPGAGHFLVGTLQHGVLGKRWVYDAMGDPVYLATLAAAALTGGEQAELYYEENGERTIQQPNATAQGSGSAGQPVPSAQDDHLPHARNDASSTFVETDRLTFLIARQPVAQPLESDPRTATVTSAWKGQTSPVTLAQVFVKQ